MISRLGAIFWFDPTGYERLLSNCGVKNLLRLAFWVKSKIMLLSKPKLRSDREIKQQLAIMDTGQDRWRLLRVIQPLVQIPVDK
jgi:hypothetical protein